MLTREREGAGSSGNSQAPLEERGREGAGESERARGRAMHVKKLTPGPPTSPARCWQSDRF